jgi:hypothetical protein
MSIMATPESTPGQTKWFCLLWGILFGCAGIWSLGNAGWALWKGEIAYNARMGRVEARRAEEPEKFKRAVGSMATPAAVFVPLSLIGFYFYRRLND